MSSSSASLQRPCVASDCESASAALTRARVDVASARAPLAACSAGGAARARRRAPTRRRRARVPLRRSLPPPGDGPLGVRAVGRPAHHRNPERGCRSAVHRVDEMRHRRVEHRLTDDGVAKGDQAAARLEQASRHARRDASLTAASSASCDGDHQRRIEVPDHRSRDDDVAMLRVEQPESRLGELADRPRDGGPPVAPEGRPVPHLHGSGAHVRQHHFLDEERHAIGSTDDVVDELVGRSRVEQRSRSGPPRLRGSRGSTATTSATPSCRNDRTSSSASGASPGLIAATTLTPPIAACTRWPIAPRLAASAACMSSSTTTRAPTRLGDAGDEPGDAFEREQVELWAFELEDLVGHRPLGNDQSETSVERCHRPRGGVAAEPRPQRFGEDAERGGGDDRDSSRQHGDAGLSGKGRHLAEEARLADAALAHQHHTGGFTGAGPPDRPAEHVELAIAADDHRRSHCPHRRHATSLVLLGLVLPRMSAGRLGCIIGSCPSKK